MIERVLLATINADHPQRGMVDGFQKVFGVANVYNYDYLARERDGLPRLRIQAEIIAAAQEVRPDWMWLQLQDIGAIRAQTLHGIRQALPRTVLSHWMGDCRSSISPYLASICRATHLTLLSNVGQIGAFMAAGAARARYLQIGLDWEEDVLGQPPWEPPFRVPEVVFCGGFYGAAFPGTGDRLAAARALVGAGIDFGVVSQSGWPEGIPVVGTCHVKQQHHVWRKASVCLNVNHFNDIELYYSDRQLIAMVSGNPLICAYVPGLEREFVNGEHCLWYRTAGELVSHARALLSDPGLRKRIGAAGRALVKARHTWEYRIRDVLPEIEAIAAGLP